MTRYAHFFDVRTSFEALGSAKARLNRENCDTRIPVARRTSSLETCAREPLGTNPCAPRRSFGDAFYFAARGGHHCQASGLRRVLLRKTSYSFVDCDLSKRFRSTCMIRRCCMREICRRRLKEGAHHTLVYLLLGHDHTRLLLCCVSLLFSKRQLVSNINNTHRSDYRINFSRYSF